MKYTFLIILLCLSIFSFGQNKSELNNKIEATDRLFKRWNTQNSPGAAIGVIHKGNLIYSKGYGLANLEHNILNTTNTAFNIASNTKQFTAACISLLVLKGQIKLNQTLNEFFPDFPDYAKNIKIDHLLHHTSGLRDFSQITYLSGLRPDDFYNDNDIVKWIGSQKELNFQPGEKYLYSNSGYWLLGQIVQKVSGMSLTKFSKQEIFTPLNMSSTQFYDNNTLIVKNRASGYSPSRSEGFRHIYSMLEHIGNGGVYTTVNDLTKWDNEYYNRQILKDDFWDLMTTQGVLNNEETIPYASALVIGKYKGLKTMDHGGRAPGYQSNIIRFPDEQFTVVVLTNIVDINATRIGYNIADIFLENKLVNIDKWPIAKSKTKNLSKKQLERYVGNYWSLDNAISKRVLFSKDTLRYERSRRSSHALLPINNAEFKMLGTPPGINIVVKFKSLSGKPRMTFIENGRIVENFEQYHPVKYATKDLATFIGKYHSEEIDTQYELKLDNNDQILLFINGEPTVPLRPVMKKLFSSPMGVFRFSENSNGGITGLKISTPRVKNLYFVKS